MTVKADRVMGYESCVVCHATLKTQDARRKTQDAKGITLIEMVAVIVVLGLAIPPLLTMWAEVALRSGRSEAIADATFYAQALMEEIKSKKFDERDSSPWSSNLGPEGEAYPNFDDVDDFHGYSDSPATGHTRSVVVDYVTLSGTNWVSSGSTTDYKRIAVSVSRTDNLVEDVSLVTIVAAY